MSNDKITSLEVLYSHFHIIHFLIGTYVYTVAISITSSMFQNSPSELREILERSVCCWIWLRISSVQLQMLSAVLSPLILHGSSKKSRWQQYESSFADVLQKNTVAIHVHRVTPRSFWTEVEAGTTAAALLSV